MSTPYKRVEVVFGATTLIETSGWLDGGEIYTIPFDVLTLLPAKLPRVFNPVVATTVDDYGNAAAALAEHRWVVHYAMGCSAAQRTGAAGDAFGTLYCYQGTRIATWVGVVPPHHEAAIPFLGAPTPIQFGDGNPVQGNIQSGHIPIHGRYVSVLFRSQGNAPTDWFLSVNLRTL